MGSHSKIILSFGVGVFLMYQVVSFKNGKDQSINDCSLDHSGGGSYCLYLVREHFFQFGFGYKLLGYHVIPFKGYLMPLNSFVSRSLLNSCYPEKSCPRSCYFLPDFLLNGFINSKIMKGKFRLRYGTG